MSHIKDKIIINMDGKQYLDYLHYKDFKREDRIKILGEAIRKFLVNFQLIFYGFITWLFGSIIIETIFSKPPFYANYGTFLLFGLQFPYLLLYVILIMIGISFIFHGFGFIIIRR